MKKKLLLLIWAFAVLLTACKTKPESTTQDSTSTTVLKSTQKKFIRKSVYAANAKKDLDDLQKALAIMRQKSCDSTNSWYYQGAMHWVPDTILNNPFCADYHTYKDLKTAWDNCTHTEQGYEQIHFLVWHRLYIYNFERIVRKLSGDPNFSLPYWGYTDTTNVTQARTMPPIFRSSSSALYEKARLDSLNNGDPISGNMVNKLSLTNLFKNTTYALFNQNIDRAPHGAMHNYVGFGNTYKGKPQMFNPIKQKLDAGGLMQDVSTAAFDPIFWVHHANIDRVWQQWTNTKNGQNVTLADLNSAAWKYTFFDENGKKVEYSMDQIIKIIYDLGYDYDDTPVHAKKDSAQAQPKLFSLKVQDPSKTIITQSPQTVVKNTVTKITIGNDVNKAKLLTADKTAKSKSVFMKIVVSFTKEPKGSYELYLNLPNGAKANPESDYFAGFMTFFGAMHHHGAMAGMNMPTAVKKTFTYEITQEAAASQALNKAAFNLSILKSGGADQEELKIESVSIFTQ